MTAKDILYEIDMLKANDFTKEQKLLWLSRAEEAVFEKFISNRSEEVEFTPITEDSVLLAPEYYAEVYLYYLMMQIDLHHGEMNRYNNSAALYNNVLTDLGNYYARLARKKKSVPLTL